MRIHTYGCAGVNHDLPMQAQHHLRQVRGKWRNYRDREIDKGRYRYR